VPQCDDSIDNDSDDFTDYPNDPGCSSADDDDETDLQVTECSDGLDNDGDGAVDYPDDPGCSSALDDNEQDPTFEEF
jgi:endoglucanase